MTIGSLITDVSSLLGIGGPSFQEQLRPASWRGIPFYVTSSRYQSGRRSAIHEYPNRDDVWVEDLGRGQRRLHVFGFIIGDDVIQQTNTLIASLQKGNFDGQLGTLVHPRLGAIQAALLDLGVSDTIEGRYAEVDFTFVESGKRLYPAAAAATPQQTLTAALAADSAAGSSFQSAIGSAITQGAAVVKSVVSTVQQYGGQVFRLVNDATSLLKTVQALPGEFGRFFAGASSTVGAFTSAAGISGSSTVTIPQLIASGAQARANVSTAMATAQSDASSLTATSAPTFATDTQAVMTVLADATSDPADQVRLFTTLAAYAPTTVPGSAAVGTAQAATSDLWRRAALTALARASAAYQPSSYDDAAALRASLVDLLEAEIEIAGDHGEDDVFSAFLALKAGVAADLTARGASLAPIVTVTFPTALPAPVVAMKLYQDASRTDELIAESGVRHPLFMPTSFDALAS